MLRLEEQLGPFLWQSSPRFKFDAARIEHLFALLPRDTDATAALAERHDQRLAGRAWTRTERRRELRHAIEIRHPSFLDPAFVALLRRHRSALVFADSVAWPYAEDLTADFVYLRLHGSEELYASGYSDEALDHWAARIKLWARVLEPNDVEGGRLHRPAALQIEDQFGIGLGQTNSGAVSAGTTTPGSAPRSTPVRCGPSPRRAGVTGSRRRTKPLPR